MSNLPPGCTMRDIEEAAGGYESCAVCHEVGWHCKCPECPDCGDVGNPECYKAHSLRWHWLWRWLHASWGYMFKIGLAVSLVVFARNEVYVALVCALVALYYLMEWNDLI